MKNNVSENMPVIFIGHGSPMNAIEDNEFSRNWKIIASYIPRPKAILCVSAHWVTDGSYVTSSEDPKTIHDFYGFPEALYKVSYKAKGSSGLAAEVSKLTKTAGVKLDNERGLDHGTWSVLRQMYPEADIPVIQLSLNSGLSPAEHYEIGKELGVLRKKGVLIIGSGNIVHNLMAADPDMYDPYPWAVEFDDFVKESILVKDHKALVNYLKNVVALKAHPTDEHYLPLLYVIGAAGDDKAQFANESFSMGSLSMRCVIFGSEK